MKSTQNRLEGRSEFLNILFLLFYAVQIYNHSKDKTTFYSVQNTILRNADAWREVARAKRIYQFFLTLAKFRTAI